MNLPKITVVTVVYNGEKYLEQTIQSIIAQTYKNIEYIIIDGGSKDSTLEIIKRYENHISHWQSEPDRGIYDAMNKGLAKASGEIITFLNADDWYEPDAVESIIEVFMQHPHLDFVFGDVIQIDPLTHHETTYRVRLNEAHRVMPLGHPALFVKTMLHRQFPFDTSFRMAADYDLVLSLLDRPKSTYAYLPKRITNFRLVGISATHNMDSENYRVWVKHYGVLRANYAKVSNLILDQGWHWIGKILTPTQIATLKRWIKKVLRVGH